MSPGVQRKWFQSLPRQSDAVNVALSCLVVTDGQPYHHVPEDFSDFPSITSQGLFLYVTKKYCPIRLRLWEPGKIQSAGIPKKHRIKKKYQLGCGGRITAGLGSWLKSKSCLISPRIGTFSRTSGRESGRESVAGSIRLPPRKSSSMNFR